MPTIQITRQGKELTVHLVDHGVLIPLGTALNVPDAKLAARGTITRLQYALERLGVKDIQDAGDAR